MPWVMQQTPQICSSGDSIYLSPARSDETVRLPAPPTVFHFLCSEEEKLGPIESGALRLPCGAEALKGAAVICICSVMKVCLVKTSVLVKSIQLTPEEQQQRANKSSQVYTVTKSYRRAGYPLAAERTAPPHASPAQLQASLQGFLRDGVGWFAESFEELKKIQEEDGQGSSARGSRAGIDGHRQVLY
ncbi:uncharacterized protein EMH_0095700 [Eimeria mitis]|uniref:Uncharacterized protein n=1 Tax=Eimeria mitis TaxID=44415 RepID=U6KKG2_9EIME|nr:uncharacterized protein EMH_0095700 [Eimeria mitis]CDJ36767.1 hypothetical protein, conserved [Eimeria mitis]